MSETPKDELRPLQDALGIDLTGDAEITAVSSERERHLRIRSLGEAAYAIATADAEIRSQPNELLRGLEEQLGVRFQPGDTLRVDVGGVSRELRIRSIGAAAYDISTPLE